MNSSDRRGYTLIEVLVAMAIFTAMVGLAATALNQGLRQYQGLLDKGVNFWDNARTLWIGKSLASATDYYVKRDELWRPYFLGSSDFISYVSLAPLAGDLPVVVWLVNEPRANGKRSLVYYELPVYSKDGPELESDLLSRAYTSGNPVTVLDDIEDLGVSFYLDDPVSGRKGWSRTFDGKLRSSLPSLVRLDYSSGGKRQALFFGLNVNSPTKRLYDEHLLK